ncbi:DinB family protein [Galbibacter sp. PAP.153]|uniref:DinB family protein n=1 Tax=Galbibacter sp. PAP.153 TaxID=3104623 RepID=UPI0030094932
MHISTLKTTEYNNFYHNYIRTLGEVSLLPELKDRKDSIVEIMNSIAEFDYGYSYAEGKWTVKQLLLHIVDTERVFQYRAFTFAREEGAMLKGFEQDGYVESSEASMRTKESLIKEFIAVRDSTLNLFEFLPENAFENSGEVEGVAMSVKAAGFIICGHQKHHENILKDRYLPFMNV